MAYKLLDSAQQLAHFNGGELVKELLDEATFKDGMRVTDDEDTTSDGRVAS